MSEDGAISPPIPEQPRGPAGVVSGNILCHSCGYRLDGLPLDGACPECGRKVEYSIRGYQLRYAAPEYLRRIGLGIDLVLVGMLASALAAIVWYVPIIIGDWLAPWWVLYVAWLVTPAIELTGLWLFTTRDRGYLNVERRLSSRRLVRVCVVVFALLLFDRLALQLFGFGWRHVLASGDSLASLWFFFVRPMFSFVVHMLWVVSVMLYCRWLFDRVPDAHRARWAKRYAWLLPLVALGGAFLGYLLIFLPIFEGDVPEVVLVGGPMLIAWAMFFSMLFVARRRIRSARAESAALA